MSMTRSRDRAYATREAASTRRTRSTGRGGPRFLLYSGVNQPSHGGTGTPTADPAGGSTGLGRSGPPTHVYQPSLALTRFDVPNPGSVQGVLHPFNYTTRKYVPQAHNPPPNGGRSSRVFWRSPMLGYCTTWSNWPRRVSFFWRGLDRPPPLGVVSRRQKDSGCERLR